MLTGRSETTPSMPARSNQGRARSALVNSSRGIIRYAGMPCIPSAVNSRANCSSPDTRRLSSELMTSATTFLPVRLASFADGSLHVDVNIGPAAMAAPTNTRETATSAASATTVARSS